MNIRQTQREKLEKVEKGLLDASRLSHDEVEKIVSSPYLLSSIKAGIERERLNELVAAPVNVSKWNWRWAAIPSVTAAAFAVMIAIVVIGRNYTTVPEAAQSPVDLYGQQQPLPERPQPIAGQANDVRPQHFAAKIEKASLRKPARAVRQKHERTEEVTDFYPLTFTAEGDITDGGQLVRVELPRSSLMAMGVDIPDNEKPKLKADLLLGADGVMKAVRFVK